MEFTDLVAAAESGDLEAQVTLGIMYLAGEEIPQDYQQALKYLQPAAAAGNEEAIFYLGGMFLNGLGVEEDVAQALAYFRTAAEARLRLSTAAAGTCLSGR